MERLQAEISFDDVVVHELSEQMCELSDLQLAAVGGGIADCVPG
jgi:hypothetical protein